MKKLPHFLFILGLLLSFSAVAQFTEDFSDGNLDTNPTWQGDLDSFLINTDQQLQLNAIVAGKSSLFTNYLAEDSLEWEIYTMMDFSPSASNALRIFLSLDQPDFENASGYFIEVGESGSADALKFYKIVNGNESLLATATMGAMSTEPAMAPIKVIFSPVDKVWTLLADYNGNMLLEEEFSVTDNEIPVSGSRFFGIECSYTSTRIDKFFFDDISVQTWSAGNPPSLISVDLIENDSMVLHFDKILSTENNQKTSRVSIDQGIGNPSILRVDPARPSDIEISLSTSINSGVLYTLCAEGMTDNGGQTSVLECRELFNIESANPGDLFINEILFNPPSESKDFVELINVSSKFISLQNLTIANAHNSQSDLIEEEIIMEPGQILVFTEDVEGIIDYYNSPAPNNIVDQNLPALNVADGNVWLYYEKGGVITTIDSFDYEEDYHFELLDLTKGVSLEKLVPTSTTNDPNSWHSAAESAGFATPGYTNSNNVTFTGPSDMVFVQNKVFSPNGDNQDDLLLIGFNLDQPGYLANIKIYNDRGYLVRYLANNTLLGSESFVKWDGITSEGIKADIGIYILLIELFDLNGNTIIEKESCVLADFLD